MNRKLFSVLLASSILLLGACDNKKPSGPVIPDYEDGEAKAQDGVGTIFNEVVGYNTKDATIFEESGTRYVIYGSNETAKGDPVFAARSASKDEDGNWVYGEKHIVLRGAESSWDVNISNPSVIKGSFAYNGTTYSYLMAYDGNNNSNNTNHHIGLAVTNDLLGEWVRVGTRPILENPESQEAAYGFGSASLLSYDKSGKGYLFYTVGETNITYEAVKTFDFSNLSNPQLEVGFATLPVTGLNDNADVNIITNASFAFDSSKDVLYMVRDRLPNSASAPGQSTALEISKASSSITFDFSKSWTNVRYIKGSDTMDPDDDDSLGWDEIYSGDFITDEYGVLLDNDSAEVVYSTYDEDHQDAKYTSTLSLFAFDL